MGRKAGHLALGIGKAAAAHVTIIPEEFSSKSITLQHVADIFEGSIIKRRAQGKDHGVAIMAEGLLELMSEDHIKEIFGPDELEYDDHGHIKLDNLELGRKVRDELRRRFMARGINIAVINKNLGYELRCADRFHSIANTLAILVMGRRSFCSNKRARTPSSVSTVVRCDRSSSKILKWIPKPIGQKCVWFAPRMNRTKLPAST